MDCTSSGQFQGAGLSTATVTPGSYGPYCATDAAVTLGGTPSGGTWSGTGVTGSIANGFTFNPATAGVGTFVLTYSVPTSSTACANSATTSVTVNPLATVTPGSYGPYCATDAAVTLGGTPSGGTWSGTGVTGSIANGFTFNPATAGVGTFVLTYSVPTSSTACANSATTSVTVNPLATVTPGSYGPYCATDAAVTLGGTPSGGTWSGTGVTGSIANGFTFNPATAGVGTFVLTYSVPTSSTACANSATTSVTVNPLATVTPGSYGPYCATDAAVTLGGTPSGGTWSGTGVTGSIANGFTFNPATAGVGTFVLTYSVPTSSTACANSATTSVTVNPLATVTPGSYGPYCATDAAVTLGGTPSGGTWSGTGVTGSIANGFTFNPATAGVGTFVLTYSVPTSSTACANSATTSVTVNPLATVTPGSYGPLCVGGSAISLSGTPSGGTWSGTGVSGSVAAGFTFTPSNAGSFTLTYAVAATATACANSATTSVTVNNCYGHIFPTQTTCNDYKNQTATPLTQVCFTKKGQSITNATPGVFFYYATITAPSSSFCVNVLQTNPCTSGYFALQQDQLIAWSSSCTKVGTTQTVTKTADGQYKVCITGATLGETIIISAKYDTKSIVGTTPPKSDCTYGFATQIGGVTQSGSEGSLKITSNCTSSSVAAATATGEPVADAASLTTSVYPNPTHSDATITFSAPNAGRAELVVYNALGAKVVTLYDGQVAAGEVKSVALKGANLATGTYFYRVNVNGVSKTNRFVIMK
ncbi:T9SS type A sorting domain-containing protein [Hymenobacter humi]|uniref:T9SS type A sorting domain-containing protein n=1 Tax=Hymenobacter humi TaxID=1411620 RepID=A0ABW2UAR9_9BACT